MRYIDFYGNWLLLRFYAKSVTTLHKLPKWMRNPDNLIETIGEAFDVKNPKSFELKVPSEVGSKYNENFDAMKNEMRSLHARDRERISYKTTLMILFAIRLLCIITAFEGYLPATLLISSLPSLVAPYSLFVPLP